MTRRGFVVGLVCAVVVLLIFVSLPYRERVVESTAQLRQNFQWPALDYLYGDRNAVDMEDFQQQGVYPSDVPSPPSVPSEQIDPVAQDWREHLDKHHAPFEYSFQFDHVYVLSTPERKSQRVRFELMAKALDLKHTFVEMLPENSATVAWISERILEIRKQKHDLFIKLDLKAHDLGGLDTNSLYLTPGEPWKERKRPFYVQSPNYLNKHPIPARPKVELTSLQDDRYDGLDWLSYLYSGNVLDPDDSANGIDIAEDLRLPTELADELQVSASSIAEWYNHFRVLEMMATNQDELALVLTDEVDIEWDAARIWSNIKRHLPDGAKETNHLPWSICFLGHTSTKESTHPSYFHPLLHAAADPRGLFGYAVSKQGYMDLLKLMQDPWMAYQTRLDVAIATLAQHGALSVFSVDPPIVSLLPSKMAALVGDKQINAQTEIRSESFLSDSTMERIWRSEGVKIDPPKIFPAERPAYDKYRISSNWRGGSKSTNTAPQLEEGSQEDMREADVVKATDAKGPSMEQHEKMNNQPGLAVTVETW